MKRTVATPGALVALFVLGCGAAAESTTVREPRREAATGAAPSATATAAPSATVALGPADDGVCRPSAECEETKTTSRGVGAGPSVSGKLPPEVISRVVRSHLGEVRRCYEAALGKSVDLRGTVKIKFTIGADGNVLSAADDGSQFASPDTIECIRAAVRRFSFPRPEGGTVIVVYPFVLEPSR